MRYNNFLCEVTNVNAVILAAGMGSRMAKDGLTIPKPLLPILGLPNIERTVLMLNEFGITNIIILCNKKYLFEYSFLNEKYMCKILPIDSNLNTLYSISYVIDDLNDTFVIEGDVVLARNVFSKLDYSFYYTMKYLNCESDAWCPILKDGIIVDFKVGRFKTPCIFGISFWHHKDCELLRLTLNSLFTEKNFHDSNLFWDDCICSILNQIQIRTYEITQKEACEMNTKKEYEFAQEMCTQYYRNCEKFILDNSKNAYSNSNIYYLHDLEACYEWQNMLVKHISNILETHEVHIDEQVPTVVFNEGEHPFMVKSRKTHSYIAYFDIAENTDYLLLRRIFVDEKFRRQGLGREIVRYINLYAKLSGKEMRVNVYDKDAEKFYISLGMKPYFKTFKF